MNSSSPPKAPNPNKVIKQQTAANQETATANFEKSLVDQETPFGSLGFEKDPVTGRWTATTQFTPEQQQLLDSYQAFGGSMNEAGGAWADFIKGQDPGGFSLDDATLDTTIIDSYKPQYQEAYDRARNQRMVELANKGIKEGSDAFISAMRDFDLNQGDVWSRLARDSRAQTIAEMLAEREQPFKEAAAIRNMMLGPTNPTWANTPTFNQPFTNVSGIIQQGHDNAMAAWNAEQANKNALMSGLFSIGGSILGGPIGGAIGGGIGSMFSGGSGWVGPGGTGPGLSFNKNTTFYPGY